MDKKKMFAFSIEVKNLIREGKLSKAEIKITQAKLSKEETNFLFKCLSTDGYNAETDSFVLHGSDNSAFLNLVKTVQQNLAKSKK